MEKDHPHDWWQEATDLRPDDRRQIELILDSLPLLSDVAHADLLVYARAGEGAVVVCHAAPHPVPSLYPTSQTGRMLHAGEVSPIFRVLLDGRDHQSVSGALVWGAPMLQEIFRIQGPDRRALAAVSSERNLLEHERLQRRDPLFRSMVTRVRDQVFAGQLQGALGLGRLTEHDGVLLVDKRGIIRYMSSVAENQYRRVGYVDSLLGEQISQLETNEYICFRSMERGACLEQRVEEGDQVWIKRAIPLFPPPPRGLFGPFRRQQTEPDGAVLFIQDITEDVRRERELKTKSAMIQEVHHRVKNNLQTVAALLRMEASRARSESVRETLRQTMSRILSIAVVHEFLSRGDASVIDVRDICSRITSEVVEGTIGRKKSVQITLEGRRFSLPAQQATSCALAMNELIQNAVEHGFVDREVGCIRITLGETDGSMVIQIADDGVGLPEGFDLATNPTLGLQIVQTLVQDDLRGRLQLLRANGVTARISFPKELCRPLV